MDEKKSEEDREHSWKRLLREKPDRVVELVFAGSVVLFAFLGWRNAQSGSQQTNELIAAAKYSAYAADRNAQAASSFAQTAQGINQGISDATLKLNLQASALRDNAAQAARLAQATESANVQALDANRPWIGIIYTGLTQADHQQAFMDFNIVNVGRRAALLLDADAHTGVTNDLNQLTDLDQMFEAPGMRRSGGKEVLVPNSSTTRDLPLPTDMSPDYLNAIRSAPGKLFIVAKALYEDATTGTVHTTRYCVYLDPQVIDPKPSNHFRNCPVFNSAD